MCKHKLEAAGSRAMAIVSAAADDPPAEVHVSGGKLKTRMVLRSRLPPDALATHRDVLATTAGENLFFLMGSFMRQP